MFRFSKDKLINQSLRNAILCTNILQNNLICNHTKWFCTPSTSTASALNDHCFSWHLFSCKNGCDMSGLARNPRDQFRRSEHLCFMNTQSLTPGQTHPTMAFSNLVESKPEYKQCVYSGGNKGVILPFNPITGFLKMTQISGLSVLPV